MIIPILVGLYRYRKLEFAYRLLLYSSCLVFINQVLYFIFKDVPGYKLSPFWNNIFNYFTVLCWQPVFVFIVFSWTRVRKQALLSIYYVLFCIVSIIAEYYLIGLEEIRTSPALIINNLLAMLIFVFSLNDLLSQRLVKEIRWSRLLLVIPFIISSIFGITLDLFMYYLYSVETENIFQRLYFVLMFVGALTFLCTALSIYWAPKKEVFI